MAKLKVGVLISGRGSNLQALIDAAAEPAYPATLVCVVSNVPGAAGLARAERAGIAAHAVDHTVFADRAGFEAALQRVLEKAGVELVCLAGFMRILTPAFVERWRDRAINVHPSLLPAFKGLDTHARAIAAGARFAGCTVHFLRGEMDAGPIIVQAVVPVLASDDAQALAARVLAEEHRIYPLAVKWIAEGRVRVQDDGVLVDDAKAPRGALVNPEG